MAATRPCATAARDRHTSPQLGQRSDLGVKAICEHLLRAQPTSLSTLDLSRNYVGPDGALALADTLPLNCCLRTLDLSRNDIDGAAAAALGQSLLRNGTLTRLALGRNDIDAESACRIKHALSARSASAPRVCVELEHQRDGGGASSWPVELARATGEAKRAVSRAVS